jgi:DNA-binding protein H-NS
MNLSSYTYEQLQELSAAVDAEIKRRERDEKAKARAQILELAKLHGLSIDDVFAKAASKKPVAAKYQNPNDASQTWSGRGRQPAWVAQQLAAGKTLESLEI